MVDEWGCWYDVEPGTNPGFLYQQNTMRDALTACITLNIFNKHCDRVKMANIAQMVNVLQSVILTEGAKMLLTPTYYIFRMYKYHQNAQLIESFVETEEIGTEEHGRGRQHPYHLRKCVRRRSKRSGNTVCRAQNRRNKCRHFDRTDEWP